MKKLKLTDRVRKIFLPLLITNLASISAGYLAGHTDYLYAKLTDKTNSQVLCYNCIPRAKEIQDGFLDPNRLEVTLEDYDNDGKQETYSTVEGIKYLLKKDKKGHPIFIGYEIKREIREIPLK